ncbi:TERF1-interacting nuclear factor 2 isoform X2 [Rhinoderma darwinii]
MKKRDVQNFGRILEFVELTHEQVPGLLRYRHHAKLSTGLRGKILLLMIEEKKPLLDILTALNCHFPPVFPDDSAAAQREVFKVRQCKIHFRKLILRMIRDEKFRQNYVKNTLHLEYGDTFMAALEKLLWEFLCRLQTVFNHQVPQITDPRVVGEDHRSGTPTHPSSRLNVSAVPRINNAKEMNMAKKKRANPIPADEPEQNTNHVKARYEERRNYAQKKQSPDLCEDTGRRISQAEGPVQQPAGSRTLDPVHGPPEGRNAVDKAQPPCFAIFGFDCSQIPKGNRENLSPPDPLQSEDLECGSDPHTRHDVTGHKSSTDLQVTAQTLSHFPVSNHEHRSVRDMSGGKYEGQGNALSRGLMSRRYQPRVHVTKLPPNILNQYLDQKLLQGKTPEEVLTPQGADSELSQSETFPDSSDWFWVCSGPTDNDSNDPDYISGHVGERIKRIQPKRGLRFSSP